MAERYLIDTDVIIEYLRGREKAVRFLESIEGELYLSVISVAGLHSGERGRDERRGAGAISARL